MRGFHGTGRVGRCAQHTPCSSVAHGHLATFSRRQIYAEKTFTKQGEPGRIALAVERGASGNIQSERIACELLHDVGRERSEEAQPDGLAEVDAFVRHTTCKVAGVSRLHELGPEWIGRLPVLQVGRGHVRCRRLT